MITLILPGNFHFYGFRKLQLHYSECGGYTTLDDDVPKEPEDGTLDALDEDFESQVEDMTLDAPESTENLNSAGNDVEESEISSSSMSYYYPYTCMLSNYVV